MTIQKSIFFLMLLVSSFAFGQPNEKILLEWKIGKSDTLKYQTTMNAVRIEPSETKKNDTSSVFAQNEMRKVLNSLADINSNLKYQTNLFANNKNAKLIDIEMVMLNDDPVDANSELNRLMSKPENRKSAKKKKGKKKESDENEKIADSVNFKNMFKELVSMNNNVVLRGRISPTGEIISNYYKSSQKNLIAILFELPNKKIAVGEKWKLQVNLIEMDQNFVCDSLSNENSVYIEKIIDTGNDRVAVIKYSISEYVSGNFNNPMSGVFGTETKSQTYMRMSHTATGNFSITKGKWISYEGELEAENNFPMFGGKSKTVFKLVE